MTRQIRGDNRVSYTTSDYVPSLIGLVHGSWTIQLVRSLLSTGKNVVVFSPGEGRSAHGLSGELVAVKAGSLVHLSCAIEAKMIPSSLSIRHPQMSTD